jgi:YVTN family beta-propeller protein
MRAPSEEEGLVYIYLRPFPHEAERLSFTLSGLAAVRDDGQEVPLTLRLAEYRGAGTGRQQLLAEGVLPQGSYAGFTMAVAKAVLKGEEGDADLLLPEKPMLQDFRFHVDGRRASVLFAGFDYARSVPGEFSFKPAFVFSVPPKPVPALAGYATNDASYAVTLLDKNSMQAVGAIATARRPKGLALDQKGRRVYVAMPDGNAVMVLDVATQETLNAIRLNLGDSPRDLALTPDGKTLLVMNAGSNTVSVVDTTLLLETARIPVGNGSNAILLDRTGKRAYVFNTLSNTLTVLDVARRSVVVTLSTDPAPLWGQFNAAGDRLYIICEQTPYLTVLDPRTFTVLSRAYVGLGMNALKVDPFTNLIYMGKSSETGVDVFDPVSIMPFDHIDTAEGPSYLTIDGEGNNLWVVGGATGKLFVVSLASKKVIAEIDVEGETSRIVLMGER